VIFVAGRYLATVLDYLSQLVHLATGWARFPLPFVCTYARVARESKDTGDRLSVCSRADESPNAGNLQWRCS